MALDRRRHVEGGETAQVAFVGRERRGFGNERQRRGAAQQEMTSAKNPRAPDARAIIEQRVAAGPAKVREHVPGDGQRFARTVRGAGGHGIKRALARPQHVGRAALHLLDIRHELRVGVQRNARLKLRVADPGLNADRAAKRRLGELPGQCPQRPLLRGDRGLFFPQLQRDARRAQTRAEDQEAFGKNRHRSGSSTLRQPCRAASRKCIPAARVSLPAFDRWQGPNGPTARGRRGGRAKRGHDVPLTTKYTKGTKAEPVGFWPANCANLRG